MDSPKGKTYVCPACLGTTKQYNPDTDGAEDCTVCNASGEVDEGTAIMYLDSLKAVENDREDLDEE